jgi:SPP1 gp7 family putative phage head morphogenesis protein
MWQQAHNRAFTVAKVMKEDILKDIKGMVQRSIDEGLTVQQFKKELTPRLQAKGWWGKQLIDGEEVQLGSPYRLNTIYRTNINVGYSVGRYQELEEQKDFAPYWQYVAVMDANTRPEHAALNGMVFKADDPFWDSFYPPNDFGCRCMVRNYTADQLKDKKLNIENSKGRIDKINDRIGDKRTKLSTFDGMKVAKNGFDYNPGKEYMRIK